MRMILLVFILSLGAVSTFAYTLDFTPEKWELKTKGYYLTSVVDSRKERSLGTVLYNGKRTEAKITATLGETIFGLITNSTEQDPSGIPVAMYIEKFKLTETGTIASHVATLDFEYVFYRMHGKEKIELFRVGGNPNITMKGPFPKPHEKNIVSSLKHSLENFNSWISDNKDIPPLVKEIKVEVSADKLADNNNSDTIVWDPVYKLKWSDFQGKVTATPFSAQSNCLFTYKAIPSVSEGVLTLKIMVSASFERTNSWVKPGMQRDTLLAHEQLHFDICELHVRRLRNQLRKTGFDIFNYEKQINELFNLAWDAYQKEQDRYDLETEHGLRTKEQFEWIGRVESMLKETEG